MSVPQTRQVHNRLSLLSLAALFALGSSATAQDRLEDFLRVRGGKGVQNRLAEFQFELKPGKTADEALLTISTIIPPGHYIYSMTDEGATTRLEVQRVQGLEAIDELPQPDHDPKREFDTVFGRTVEKYLDKVTWTQRYRLLPGTKPADVLLAGRVAYQICNSKACVPSKAPFDLRLAEVPPMPDRREEQADLPAPAPAMPARAPDDAADNGPVFRAAQPVPEFTASLRPVQDGRGELVLEIAARIPAGYHIFSMGKNDGSESVVEIERAPGLEPVENEFRADRSPEVIPNEAKVDDASGQPDTVEIYHDHVTWRQTYRVSPQGARGPHLVEGVLSYQICNKTNCRNLRWPFKATTGDAEVFGTFQSETTVHPAGGGAEGLFLFLAAAAVAGFAALLTPCVFPMIPITVSFFQKQSEKQHHRPVTMATVYCLGIIGTFTVLGLLMSALFGAASLNTLANNPWLNLFIAGVLVFFGFNLLGLFEIRMPGWLLTYTANQEGRGGFVGVLFMALTFTLTSFTCTFAFAGALLAAAANGDRLWPALGLLAFSAAFALPFFFLALFPSFLQRLPKSGGWMNVAKVIMGLVEVGAAFKFLSVADLSWHPVAWIFDYELVMSAWMIISITAGLYLLGMFRLPHDVATEHIGVMRFISAISFLGLAAYLAVGLYAVEKPSGKVWQNILAFAPPRFSSSTESFGPAIDHGGIKYALDYRRAIEVAAKQNKPVFVDFTGVNCANCRLMENGPMSRPQITERLKNFICVQVYADTIPVIADKAERQRLLAENLKLQEWFGDPSLPSYAIIPPDPNIAADAAGEELLSVTIGYNPDEERFARFLDQGLNRWRQRQANRGGAPMMGKR